ncbi:MAG TPA: IclR family transcriptional regulator [Terriglobia bacterium]|nr:IclR family transcriptional regulator [Terriglobia bacterium]
MDFSSTKKAVPSVDRALNLLELLASASTGMTITTISRRLSIPKSSAYYLVTTLAKRNFVRRKAGEHLYFLGTNAPPFATNTDAESDLKQLCSPHIRALSQKLGMVAQIGIREGSEVRIIDRSEIPGLRLDSWVGRHFDLHCTAVGKALISYLTDSEVESLVRTRGLPRHNRNTLCSMELLKAQFTESRRLGFSTDDEEHELGVRCVASPIFNHIGGVAAAVCIFAPIGRLAPEEMPNVGAEVVKAAQEISRKLADHPVRGFLGALNGAETQAAPGK